MWSCKMHATQVILDHIRPARAVRWTVTVALIFYCGKTTHYSFKYVQTEDVPPPPCIRSTLQLFQSTIISPLWRWFNKGTQVECFTVLQSGKFIFFVHTSCHLHKSEEKAHCPLTEAWSFLLFFPPTTTRWDGGCVFWRRTWRWARLWTLCVYDNY